MIDPALDQHEIKPRDEAERPSKSLNVQQAMMHAMTAGYDAARTRLRDSERFAGVDNLSANAANDFATRDRLRTRVRHEALNNAFIAGLVRTLANDTIGTGPRAEVMIDELDEDAEAEKRDARNLSRLYERWARATDQAQRLRLMRKAKLQNGESFAFARIRDDLVPRTGVPIDWRLIEADQVESPHMLAGTLGKVSGVVLGEQNEPVAYELLERHPGDAGALASAHESRIVERTNPSGWRQVIHYFVADREGQHRGIPELTSALLPASEMRSYMLAVRAAAETAATLALVLQTQQMPDGMDADEWEPLEQLMKFDSNAVTMLPAGYKMEGFQGSQPTNTLDMFQRSQLREIGRPVNMPQSLVAGDSQGLSFSAARMDHIPYRRAIEVERSVIEDQILQTEFETWFRFAQLAGIVPDRYRDAALAPEVEWSWPAHAEIDPLKSANADRVRIQTGTDSRRAIAQRMGRDPDELERQVLDEVEKYAEPDRESQDAQGTPTRDEEDEDAR